MSIASYFLFLLVFLSLNWQIKVSMKKLLRGIVEFREKRRPALKDIFAKLALGQSPDVLFIGCSDSRVAVNTFASTDPGDLFVVRNVGNLVPPADKKGISTADESEAAAIEFALTQLKVKDIIVCGHSECGAMHAVTNGRNKVQSDNLRSWLRHAEEALEGLKQHPEFAPNHAPHNRLSQANVLLQMEHLKTYPVVRQALEEKRLGLHGWWFELDGANVYAWEEELKQFVIIDEDEAHRIIDRLGSP